MTATKSGIEPPPAWSATFDAGSQVVVALYGAQAIHLDDLQPFREWLGRTETDEPGHYAVDHARFTDEAGLVNEVRIFYWRNPGQYEVWASSNAVHAWWTDRDREEGLFGIWREIIVVPSDRIETILSAPTVRIGSSRVADTIEGPIAKKGYWGAMRDRLPIAETDPLLSDAGEELKAQCLPPGNGKRLLVRPPQNLTLIRSGQDATRCSAEEAEEYEHAIRPVLQRGMDYLRDHPEETGCCCCRFMEELTPDGQPSSRSFGLAWFLTLGHLERWSKSHPTHLAIYNRFSAFAQKRGPNMGLELWHEVAVLSKNAGLFEYVNCHDRTGLLGCFDVDGGLEEAPESDASVSGI